jgi:hypothetical protein
MIGDGAAFLTRKQNEKAVPSRYRAPMSEIPAYARNLRLRPAKPALGRGRLQRQVRYAFWANKRPLSTREILEWAYPRKLMLGERITDGHRWSVRRVCRALCEPVGRASTIGRLAATRAARQWPLGNSRATPR